MFRNGTLINKGCLKVPYSVLTFRSLSGCYKDSEWQMHPAMCPQFMLEILDTRNVLKSSFAVHYTEETHAANHCFLDRYFPTLTYKVQHPHTPQNILRDFVQVTTPSTTPAARLFHNRQNEKGHHETMLS